MIQLKPPPAINAYLKVQTEFLSMSTDLALRTLLIVNLDWTDQLGAFSFQLRIVCGDTYMLRYITEIVDSF